MCRLYMFCANEETKVECTLVRAQNALLLQSQSDRLGRSHADGWGIAFYHGEIPERERRSSAAFADLHFGATAERVYARTVVAHVRLATVGLPDVRNCHPFMFERWTFAHNGTVTGFSILEAEMLAETDADLRVCRLGQTDSELLFLWLLTRIRSAGIDLHKHPSANAVGRVVAESIVSLAERCHKTGTAKQPRLNIVLSDGHVTVATRWNNDLFFVFRKGVHDCEICGIPHVHHDQSTEYLAVIIASEPISDEAWTEVPNHSVVTVTDQIELAIRPVQAVLQDL